MQYMTLHKIRQNKYFILWLIVFLVGFCQSQLFAELNEKNFKRLSHREKSMLRNFFETTIKMDQLGHVLFFSTKPACFFIVNTANEEDVLTKAWRTWKFKEHLFQHPNFILYEETCDKKSYIYFINKQTLLSKFSFQEELLKQLFGESFSIKDFIAQLEKNTLNTLISKNQVLLGLLLGYGIESSLDYPGYLAPDPYVPGKELTRVICVADEKITTLQVGEEVTICKFNSKVPIHPVSFIGNASSEEVKNLKKIYSQELEKIELIYQCKNLLQLCLQRLCS